ncbi:MAG: tyramine oxidase, partial [Phreatobacter sp.]|nr:tyramine oxidase [Phreatobacter sp.]
MTTTARATAVTTPAHPLDPLSGDEIAAARAILFAGQALPASTRFTTLQLDEPLKAEIAAWSPGRPIRRRAFAVTIDTATGAVHEALVDIGDKTVVSFVARDTKAAPYGQPAI